MAYLLVSITGTGTQDDPFRPLFPVTIPPITSLPGFRWTAHIPSNPDGTPRFTDCYVWIPNTFTLPGGITVQPLTIARTAMLTRDPRTKPSHMERMP